MSDAPRAGILVTGTEVLSGRVRDRNGPWLADRLLEAGVDLAQIAIVGDRPRDLLASLESMASEGLDVVLTSGGLGPTADDLTAEVVGSFQGREMVLDEALEGRIAEILRPLAARYPNLDRDAIAHGNRKQATIPRGATVLEPVGTAPGLVVAPAEGREGPTVVVLPGPPRELQPMWKQAVATDAWRSAIAGARVYRSRDAAPVWDTGVGDRRDAAPRRARRSGPEHARDHDLPTQRRDRDRHPLRARGPRHTTRSRRSSPRAMPTRSIRPTGRRSTPKWPHCCAASDWQASQATRRPLPASRARADQCRTIAVAESCTGGLLLARLTDPPGASEYVLGGVVAYSNEAKIAQVGVPGETIEAHGAVSEQVAQALAEGARARLRRRPGSRADRHRRPWRRQRGEACGARMAVLVWPTDARA